ncbi:MAG: DUF6268 family outer membrane beta-barrel protein [Planctomycetota bacterium]
MQVEATIMTVCQRLSHALRQCVSLFFLSFQLIAMDAIQLVGEEVEFGGPQIAPELIYASIAADPNSAPLFDDAEEEIPRFRKSFFQGFEWKAGHLIDLGDEAGGLDVTFQDARVSFGLPLGSLDNILGIAPFFRTTHLNGPTTVDVPETLFDTGVGFFHQKKWSTRWSTTILVSPMVRSDFSTSDDAFRLFGLGLATWKANDQIDYSIGVLHLDREDVSVLPVFGFVWRPSKRWRFDGMMPQPKVSYRLWKDGSREEAWASIGGAFGGNSWSVKRDDPATMSRVVDQLTLRDFRVFGEYQLVRSGRRGWLVQAGYAFGRSLEYEKLDLEIDLDDALYLEATLQF